MTTFLHKGCFIARGILIVLIAVFADSACRKSADGSGSINERALEGLPYLGVGANRATRKSDVDRMKSENKSGFFLFRTTSTVQDPSGRAWLIDRTGTRVHEWSSVHGQSTNSNRLEMWATGWDHVEVGPDAFLYVIVFGRMIMKIDWDSNVHWSANVAAHHDMDFDSDGQILAIADRIRRRPSGAGNFLDQEIVKISPTGEFRERISLFDVLMSNSTTAQLVQAEFAKRFNEPREKLIETAAKERAKLLLTSSRTTGTRCARSEKCLRQEAEDLFVKIWNLREDVNRGVRSWSPNASEMAAIHNTFFDIFHTNSIEILASRVPGFGEPGDLLISMRHLDLIFLIDRRDRGVKWHWGPGVIKRQHHPTVMNSGNILVFDNRRAGEPSRVVEVEPVSTKVVWQYTGDRAVASPGWGSVEELANGNLLTIEPFEGRIVEVSRAGRVVWEYWTPSDDGKRAMPIYRVQHVSDDMFGRMKRRSQTGPPKP